MRRIISESPVTGTECSFCKNTFFTLHECRYSDDNTPHYERILKCGRCGETVRVWVD